MPKQRVFKRTDDCYSSCGDLKSTHDVCDTLLLDFPSKATASTCKRNTGENKVHFHRSIMEKCIHSAKLDNGIQNMKKLTNFV